MRLMIAVPCLDMMRTEFVISLTNIVKRMTAQKVDFDIRFAQSTLTYQGRDILAREAIERQFDFMLWFDSDMVIPVDAFDKLMAVREKTNAALVTGIYRCRRKPYRKLVYRLISAFQGIYCDDNLPEEPFPIEGCGFGCVLVDVQAIRDVCRKYNLIFTPERGLGEDLAFCLRLKELGHRMYAEPSVKCSHIGSIAISCDDATKLLEY